MARQYYLGEEMKILKGKIYYEHAWEYRLKVWLKDHRCYLCKQPTVFIVRRIPSNDHPKLIPPDNMACLTKRGLALNFQRRLRGIKTKQDNKKVLLCLKCCRHRETLRVDYLKRLEIAESHKKGLFPLCLDVLTGNYE
jgi:hypothetical protein